MFHTKQREAGHLIVVVTLGLSFRPCNARKPSCLCSENIKISSIWSISNLKVKKIITAHFSIHHCTFTIHHCTNLASLNLELILVCQVYHAVLSDNAVKFKKFYKRFLMTSHFILYPEISVTTLRSERVTAFQV